MTTPTTRWWWPWARRAGKTTLIEQVRVPMQIIDKEDMPPSDHVPTVDRQTTHAIIRALPAGRYRIAISPIIDSLGRDFPMSINNRQIALLAAALKADFEDSARTVMEEATSFLPFLDGQDFTAGTPGTEGTDTGTDTPFRGADLAQDDFEALVERNRTAWGSAAVDALLDADGVLLEQEDYDAAIDFAIANAHALRLGTIVTDSLLEQLGALRAGTTTEASVHQVDSDPIARDERTGSEIIALLQTYLARYGAPVQPLLDRAQALRSTPLASAKGQAVGALLTSDERRTYPTQVDALIADIQAL